MKAASRSVLVVTAACAVVLAAVWWLPTTSLYRWQDAHLHWNYALQILFFIIPLSILATRRRTRADYGLVFAEPRWHARLGVMLVIVLVIVPLVIEAIFGRLALNRMFAAFPLSTIVFHFVFSSFGEELFFRGFVQGELNLAFGRRWKFAGVAFGPGLVVAALIFAAGHAFRRDAVDVQQFIATGIFAVFAGLLRERTGGVVAPAMLHATIDLNWHFLRLDRVLKVAQFVCTGVAFFFVLRLINEPRPHEPAARLAALSR